MKQSPFATAMDRLGVDLLSVSTIPNIKVDLRYNGRRNFMNVDLYQGFHEAYLHRDAWQMLNQVAIRLEKEHAGFSLLIFDALRPRSVQRRMRNFVKGTNVEEFVADPELGSMHNFGMAVDLSIENTVGRALDMGTEFDDFSEKAQPQLEDRLLLEKKLTPDQVSHRRLLRSLMESAGFEQLQHEWWHYNAKPAGFVRKNYKIVE